VGHGPDLDVHTEIDLSFPLSDKSLPLWSPRIPTHESNGGEDPGIDSEDSEVDSFLPSDKVSFLRSPRGPNQQPDLEIDTETLPIFDNSTSLSSSREWSARLRDMPIPSYAYTFEDVMTLAASLDAENDDLNMDRESQASQVDPRQTAGALVRRNSFSVSRSIKTDSYDSSSAKEGRLSGLGSGLRRLLSSSSINLSLTPSPRVSTTAAASPTLRPNKGFFSMRRNNTTTVEEIEGGKKALDETVLLMSQEKSMKGNQREFLKRFKATQMYAEYFP
jgi:hypothetical protein